MPGYFLVCPTSNDLTVKSDGTPACQNASGSSGWEIHHTDELTDQLAGVLKELFTLPPIEQMAQVFGTVVGTIMMAYMVAWGVGLLLSQFNPDQGD